LLDYIESNGIKIVLVERADRLARDLMVGEVILGQFRDLGVSVIATDSGVDLTTSDDDPTRTLIRQVLGAVSQFEKSIIVLKLRAARERTKRKTGRCEGRKPYGYYPGEDKTVKRIKELYRKPHGEKRMSLRAIARKLNEEGIPTRTGAPWSGVLVKSIVTRKK
jgi:DNA invertase Pin-like site-specific DNA recombinase